MEAIWFFAWVMVLTPPDSSYPAFGAMVALMVMATLLARASASLLRRSHNQILLLAVSLVVLPIWLLTVLGTGENWGPRGWAERATALIHDAQPGPTALVAFGAVGLAVWCRGLWLGAVPAGTDALRRRFLGGAAALVALSALLSPGKGTGVARFTDGLQLLVLGYFIIAPIAVALEHVQTLDGRATTARTVSLAWIMALLVPVTAIAAVGLLLCNGVAPALGWLMHVVTQAVLLLWFGFLWLLEGFGVVLYWLAGLFPFAWHWGTRPGGPAPVVLPPWQQSYAFSDPVHIPALAPAILLLLLAVLSVHFLTRRSRSRPAAHVDEERSSLWSWQLLRDQFMTAWRALLDRFRARARGVFGATAGGNAAKVTGMGGIREIYRGLLRWAAVNGHRRRPATTPNELQCELLGAMPMASAAIELITQNYEFARYGDVAIEDAAIAASQAAIRHLENLSPD
jgi:hypothetical protein